MAPCATIEAFTPTTQEALQWAKEATADHTHKMEAYRECSRRQACLVQWIEDGKDSHGGR
jgi:hypothetical protein